MAEERLYLAYLVRLWAVSNNGDVMWRALAEDAHTGERRVFADLGSLCAFLNEITYRVASRRVNEERQANEDNILQ